MSLCPVKRLFPTSFVVATLLLCLHGCVVPRYTVADTHCGDFGRGTVYALKSGNRWHGAVFDKDCLIFPGPQFKTRFTPTTDEIRRIDRILRENLPAVIDTAEKYGVKDRLKSRNSLRKYLGWDVGGLSPRADRIVWVKLFYQGKNRLFPYAWTTIVDVLDGGDECWEAYVLLDTGTLSGVMINGQG